MRASATGSWMRPVTNWSSQNKLAMYTPHTEDDIREMLAVVGVESLDELVRVPDAVAIEAPLDVPPGLPELELQRRIGAYSARNSAAACTSFLGAGAYRHYVPPVIGTLAMRGEFLTAYTPYQAEVSQGYLQAIYEWQSYICAAHRACISPTRRYTTVRRHLPRARSWQLMPRASTCDSSSRAPFSPQYRAVLAHVCPTDIEISTSPNLATVAQMRRTIVFLGARGASLPKNDVAAVVRPESPNFFGADR